MKKKIYIAGHTGLVGSSLVRYFSKQSSVEMLTAGREELDLLSQEAVERFLTRHKPDAVIIAAGKVG
ncbi:MAG: NAD-dependent epimerase/dehydratase family protein, partial [bacterium]|nr:NAD-dependent epimerase/dehydratase family protein [bacterium]